jgi:hypothetical protein
MKALKILIVIAVVIVVALAGVLFWASRYVQSPAFKQTVLETATSALGSDVQIANLNISLFSGAQLENIKVANPKGFEGNLLAADKFVLRYRLMPLLKKQLTIEELSIVAPRIVLASNAEGTWNYEALTASAKPATAPKEGQSSDKAASSSPLDVTLSKMKLENGVVEMLDNGELLVRMKDINLTSSASLAGNRLSGSGQASVNEINVANALYARNIATPVSIGTEEVKLAPLSGQLAKGAVTGSLALKLKDEFKYVVDIQLKDGDLPTLLKEAGTSELMTGKLQLNAALEGTGGMETISGKGSAHITGGKLAEIPALTLVANLLQIPELKGIAFEECRLEFTMANNVMQTPVIRLKAPKIEITGKGSVQLSDYSLDHKMTLALDKSLLAKLPKEIRAAFQERTDGYLSIDFTVKGPYDAPKTDLSDRLVKGATESLINKGLEKLFK